MSRATSKYIYLSAHRSSSVHHPFFIMHMCAPMDRLASAPNFTTCFISQPSSLFSVFGDFQMYRSKKIDDSGQVIGGSWRDDHQSQERGQVYNLGHLSLHHGQTALLSARFGAWPHWNNFHQPYWLHGHHVLGSKPYYYSSAAEADPFLRTRALSVTGASILQGCSSYQNDRSMNNQIRLLRDEENNHHDPLDLELTLDIGPRRRDKRIKRSRSSWGREDEENVDRDQEVESATDTGLSLSFFSSP